MTPDSNELLARVDAGAEADAMRELSVKALVSALEGSAANTDTDPRWVAASALRNLTNWEGRTIALSAPVPSPDGAALRSAPVSGPAKEPGWGQIVQLLLRAMDTSAKTENAAALAERMADGVQKLYGRVPAVGVTREAIGKAVERIVDTCRECRLGKTQESVNYNFDNSRAQCIKFVTDAILALSPVPDATVSEPVAHRWRYKGSNGEWAYSAEYPKFVSFNLDSMDYEPLYTPPQHVDREATVSARDGVIAECASSIAAMYPDNAQTNAFCAAIRSLASGAKP